MDITAKLWLTLLIPNSSAKLARNYRSQEQTAPKNLVFDEKLGSQNHSADMLGTL
jgi:hypothetical protein